MNRAIVLGAGLQGTCASLALARAGWSVEVVDRAVEPLLGASRRGEGKVHLGLVYANEPSRTTAGLMIDGALSFSRLLDGWVAAPIDWTPLCSQPFDYVVLADSLLGPTQLREHYDWVVKQLTDRFAAGERYLGRVPDPIVEEVAAGTVDVAADAQAVFRTAEVAVEMRRLRPQLVDALDAAGVTFAGDQVVHAVSRGTNGFEVERSQRGGATWCTSADIVVNCLWDGRLAVDATMGLVPERPWVYRLKQSIEGRLPAGAAVPGSITFVLGPFGDVVTRHDGDVYASWYPTCLAGWSAELAPPQEWRAKMDGDRADGPAASRAQQIVDDFAELVPVLRKLDVTALHSGVIVAWGETDIDDRASELHSRHAVGVHAHDGYFSIDTGKLTTAPLFAQHLVEQL